MCSYLLESKIHLYQTQFQQIVHKCYGMEDILHLQTNPKPSPRILYHHYFAREMMIQNLHAFHLKHCVQNQLYFHLHHLLNYTRRQQQPISQYLPLDQTWYYHEGSKVLLHNFQQHCESY
jgi:hypothetical protein